MQTVNKDSWKVFVGQPDMEDFVWQFNYFIQSTELGKTVEFWTQYTNHVNFCLTLIKAVKTNNFYVSILLHPNVWCSVYKLNVDENHPGAEVILKRGAFSVSRSFIPEDGCAVHKTIEETFMKHAKSRGGGKGVGVSGISNNREVYQQWARTMHQENLAMAQLEKSDNGNEHYDLGPSEIQQSEKNNESSAEAFENLLHLLDVEYKEGIYCISPGLSITHCACIFWVHHLCMHLLKAEIYGKEMKDNIIIEHLETHINFLDSIKRSKLKIFESANKKVMVKTSDKRLIEYK